MKAGARQTEMERMFEQVNLKGVGTAATPLSSVVRPVETKPKPLAEPIPFAAEPPAPARSKPAAEPAAPALAAAKCGSLDSVGLTVAKPDPDLNRLILAWPVLSKRIRETILAVLDTSDQTVLPEKSATAAPLSPPSASSRAFHPGPEFSAARAVLKFGPKA